MSDPYGKTAIKNILIQRDDMEPDEADSLIEAAQSDIDDIIDEQGSLMEIEQVIEDHFGLEPDYIMDFIPF